MGGKLATPHVIRSQRRKVSRLIRRRRLISEMLERRYLLAAGVGDDNFAVGDQLREYRLAIAATAEYTSYFGDQASAFAAIQDTVASLNEIFVQELSIEFDLISDTRSVFTDSATDGYTNGFVSSMLFENTPILDGIYTNASYDIGHVFGQGSGGGLAWLSSVNSPTEKGRGVSTSTNPFGANFVNLVAHEIGHQFGALHTFNASAFAGGGQARNASSAYEVASGSTLMSYAGVVDNPGDNLQQFSDSMFHAASFEQIEEFVNADGAASTTTTIDNSIPTIDAGIDFTIPAGTPFVLEATGTDADSDTLTYSWDQLDLASSIQGLPVFDTGSGPLFRSFLPSSENQRVFPRLPDLLNNVDTNAIGEALPTMTRDVNFRVTARDGRGGVNSDDVRISVVDTDDPFMVVSPNTAVTWTGGATETILWDVAGTDDHGINAATVAIDLSLDGGYTYPISLASAEPNDGEATIQVPNINVADARLRIRGEGNIFFDVSDSNFMINANTLIQV